MYREQGYSEKRSMTDILMGSLHEPRKKLPIGICQANYTGVCRGGSNETAWLPSYVILGLNTHAKPYISEVYLDQLTFCKVKLLLCRPAYHAVATIGPGDIFVGQLGEAPALVEEGLVLDVAEGRRLEEA